MVTTEAVATTTPSPIVTPGRTVTFDPSHARLSMAIGTGRRVLGVADSTLDPGASPVPGLEERQLAGLGADDKRLVAPTIAFLEQP